MEQEADSSSTLTQLRSCVNSFIHQTISSSQTVYGCSNLTTDVITIETSRSDMELLTAFGDFKYPNDIGPGVYDIHSPRVPTEAEVERLLCKAMEVVPVERLWVNPDCGLKTRGWKETLEQLEVMMAVTKKLRKELADKNVTR